MASVKGWANASPAGEVTTPCTVLNALAAAAPGTDLSEEVVDGTAQDFTQL